MQNIILKKESQYAKNGFVLMVFMTTWETGLTGTVWIG